MKKTVLIVLADGFEEMEAITPMDILRRAGIEVTVAGVGKREVTGAHGVRVTTDIMFEQYSELPDAVLLPGGPGVENLKQSNALDILLTKMREKDKIIAAICAAPAVVLAPTGILDGKKATCYPGYEKEFRATTTFLKDRVVRDGRLLTSRGPGTALEFSLDLAAQLVGSEAAEKVAGAVMAKA